jgi:hypothetical protein
LLDTEQARHSQASFLPRPARHIVHIVAECALLIRARVGEEACADGAFGLRLGSLLLLLLLRAGWMLLGLLLRLLASILLAP